MQITPQKGGGLKASLFSTIEKDGNSYRLPSGLFRSDATWKIEAIPPLQSYVLYTTSILWLQLLE
ncbi:MAG TPA: hypothetical protein VGQ61_12295, partial [Candidatus Angelobacter sp.]|nr:hypothetical protein [Candidatus Angelobacter sp.]